MCIPRKCYSSAAMLAADLEFSGKLGKVAFDLHETIEKITPVIIDWNVNKTYSQREANCQQFIDELCHVLDIPIRFEGPLGEYLHAIRERGECELEFPVSAEMRVAMEIRDKKKKFNTHKEVSSSHLILTLVSWMNLFLNALIMIHNLNTILRRSGCF
jgi:hypothetical protein